MRTSFLLSLSIPVSIALFPSCTPGPLEGDWFQCLDQTCTTLDDEGVRFTAGGRWAGLGAEGSEYKPGDFYELENDRGTYTLEGNTLTLHLDGSNETHSVEISFDGDDLLVHGAQVSVACTDAVGSPGPSTCQEVSGTKVIRFRRIGPAGEVPELGGPRDDRVSGTSTIEPPPPAGD